MGEYRAGPAAGREVGGSASRRARALGVGLGVAIGLGGLAGLPTGAAAAGTDSCDAGVLPLSLLGALPVDPIRANPGFSPCVGDAIGLTTVPALGPVQVDAVRATTQTTPNVAAVSRAEIVGLRVPVTGLLGSSQLNLLTGALLTDPNGLVGGLLAQINTALAGVPLLNTLTGLLGLQAFGNDGLVTALTTKLPGALTTALNGAVPQVLAADVIEATAQAQCVNGAPQISGGTRYANLTALGQSIDPNGALAGPLNIDTKALNLGALITVDDVLRGIKIKANGPLSGILYLLIGGGDNLYELLHSKNGVVKTAVNALLLLTPYTFDSLLTSLTSTLQPLLNAITVTVPAGLLHARVTPQSQAIAGDQLTQKTIAVSVSALTLPLLDGTLAQARVGAGAPGCVPPTVPPEEPPPAVPPVVQPRQKPVPKVENPTKYSSPAAEAVLRCGTAPATLIDVFEAGRRTFVQGVAERRFVGQQATIYLQHGHRRVGRVKVDEDGLFSTTVALPPRRIRTTNKARYYAVVGGKRTRALKFSRRMLTTDLTARRSTVALTGQVTAPRRGKQAAIVVKQRIGCTVYKTVATVKPNARGRFTARIKAPKDLGAAVYRAQTSVPRERTSKRDFRTFTLPRVVGL